MKTTGSTTRPGPGSAICPKTGCCRFFARHATLWRIGWMLVAILMLVLPGQAAEPIDDYKLAIGLYKQGRWQLAAETFQKFLTAAPRHPSAPLAQFYGGLSLRNAEQFEAARTLLRTFAAQNPQNENLPFALFRVAECSYFLDEFAVAEQEFQAYIKQHPQHELNEWALPWLAESQLRQNKAKEAIENYRLALRTYPKGPLADDSLFYLARSYEQQKQYDEAVTIYKQIAAQPAAKFAPQAALNLAERYFATDQFEQAEATYARFEKEHPQHALLSSAQLYHGYALFELRRYDEAQKQFALLEDNEKYGLKSRYWLALCYRAKNEFDKSAEVLTQVLKQAGQDEMTEPTLFYLADVESKQNRPKESIQHYEQLADDWPNGKYAPQGLYNAAVAAINASLLPEANQLVARFDTKYPKHRLSSQIAILKGRIALAEGTPEKLEEAGEILKNVLDASPAPQPIVEFSARVYLAETYRKQNRHQPALDALQPLFVAIRADDKAASRFADGLALGASSAFELQNYKLARELATRYVSLDRGGDQYRGSLVTLLLSEAHLGNVDNVNSGLKSLAARVDDERLVVRTQHDVAEIYFAGKKWKEAQQQFETLVGYGKETPYYEAGLSGWAWCLHHQNQLVEAAERFGQLVKESPQAELAPEAAFMQARSLQDAQKNDEAIAAYEATLLAYAPAEPIEGSEKAGPGYYAYRAGLQGARLLRTENRIQPADAAYERLLTKFPHPDRLDLLLDEWALLNYEAQNFARSDEIFRRLIEQVPDSSLKDNAQLSLAESDYLAGRLDVAQKSFNELVAADSSDDEVREVSLHHLAAISVEKREWKTVDDLGQALIAKFPESKHADEVRFWRAEALLNLEQNAAAQTELKTLLENVEKENIQQAAWRDRIWVLLAETYQREKDYDKVEATVADLRTRSPESPLLYQADEVLGRSFKNRAQFKEAQTVFQRVIDSEQGKRTPTAAKAQLLIADMLLAQDKVKEAQTEYLKVYVLYDTPEWQAPALYQAAQCDEVLKQVPTALTSYNELITKFPKSKFALKARERIDALK